MASTHAKAVRRADALRRLSTALNINVSDLEAFARGDAELARIMTLERLADELEAQISAQPRPGDLRAMILAASDEELTSIPGIGGKSLEQLRAWAKTPIEQQLEEETGHDVVKTSSNPPTFVETSKPAPKSK